MCDKHEPGCLFDHSGRKGETVLEYKRVLGLRRQRLAGPRSSLATQLRQVQFGGNVQNVGM